MTQWFVRRSDDGEVLIVARVRDEAGGLHPEVWAGGAWAPYPRAMNYLFDPLAADEVDQAAAEAAIAELMGG